jgi:hypothetical protein
MTTEPLVRACAWCSSAFRSRVSGGKAQRFCRAACRRGFDAAGRRWVADAIANGMLTIDALRSGAAATRALLPGAIPPAAVLRGGAQPGDDAAVIVEDRPSVEPTQSFEVDTAWLWGQRLTLWRRWRMWGPQWGPRPDQDDCQAPDYLL